MASNILNFSPDRLITGINIIDGMLFFTDNKNEPKKINIEKFKGNSVDPQSGEAIEVSHNKTTKIYGREFKERDITVLKEHPVEILSTFLTESADLKPNEVPSYTSYNPDPVPGSTEGGASSEVTNSILTSGLIITNFTDPASSIDNVLLKAAYSGTNDVTDIGFIWSQDYSKDSDLIQYGTPISLGANKQEATLTDYGQNFGAEIPAAQLDATKEIIYFLPYGEQRGVKGRVYTKVGQTSEIQVQELRISTGADAINTSKSISSLTVNANQRSGSSGFLGSDTLAVDFNASYNDDGVIAGEVGFYVSKGYALSTDTITLGELIEGADYDSKVSIENINLELPAKLKGKLAHSSKYFTGNGAYSFEQSLNYFYVAYVRASNGITYYSSNSFSSGLTLPALTENVITKIEITPSQNGEGVKPQVKNGESQSINASPPSVELKGEVLFNTWTNARTGFITEYGFYFSKKVTNYQQFITAFSSGVQADGSPVKSGFPDTYKVAVESNASGVVNIDINDPSFSYDVSSKLTLENGEKVYLMAYAVSNLGAEGVATEKGITITPHVTHINAGTGEGGQAASISIFKSDYSITTSELHGPVAFDITYRIDYVPPGRTVETSGVYLALPLGDSINSVTAQEGFKSYDTIITNIAEHTQATNFTFTGTSSSADHPSVGDYNAVVNPPNHGLQDIQAYKDAGGKLQNGYSLFAFVQLDQAGGGEEYRSNVVSGPNAHKFVFGSSTISVNEGAPTVNTYNNDLRAIDEASIRNNTFKLLGAIGSDGGVNTPHAANDVGFYISKVQPNYSTGYGGLIPFDTAIANWIADSSTVKLQLGDPNNPNAALTAARTHSISGGLTFQNYELVVNATNFPALGSDTAPTDYYYRAFCTPTPQTDTSLNETKFGGQFKVTTISATQAQNTNPIVTTDEYRSLDGLGFSLRGTAKSTENTYTIKTKKFYYKDASHFLPTLNASQIVTELQDPTGRNLVNATGDDSFSASVNLSNADYYFVAAVTTELNGVESSEVFASRAIKIPNAKSVVTTVPAVVINTLSVLRGTPPTLGAQIIAGESTISSRGFYFIGKQGTNSLAKPATGAALKTAATSVPSGQVGGVISSSSTNQNFYELFSDFKSDHTYYFSAFAINSKGETITPPRSIPTIQANTPKTLKATPGLVVFDSRGTKGASGTTQTISVQTTPNANAWSWKVTNFKGTYEAPNIVRETSGGVDKLLIKGFPLNSTNNTEAKLTITHKENASIKTEIIIKQDGKYNDNFHYAENPNDYSDYQPRAFYY